jgi:hypothetical protein
VVKKGVPVRACRQAGICGELDATLHTASRTSNTRAVAGWQPIVALHDSADNYLIDD